MYPVYCCCDPNNHIGYLPEGAPLPLREYGEPGNWEQAYSSHGKSIDEIELMPGFQKPTESRKKGGKTWRKK